MKAVIRLVAAHGEGTPKSKDVEIEGIEKLTIEDLLNALETETYANDILEVQFLNFK